LRFLIERLEAREFLSFQNYISRKFIGFIAQNTLGINANYTQRFWALRSGGISKHKSRYYY
ncbi:hypothetical protein, partial [Flavobacterium psychrophilum]|uniref:hypothetical protein n=1 Tax=Flavobacterium psychrophilum TaxID=96345 RepID=UPI001ABD221D